MHFRCKKDISSSEPVRGRSDGVDSNTSEGTNSEVSCGDVTGFPSTKTEVMRFYR